MRIALLSDIHANFAALEAVHDDLSEQDVALCWFLGDVVGYGPEPGDCLLWLAQLVHAAAPDGWVLGNHDALLANLLYAHDLDDLNHTPREAIALNRAALAGDDAAEAFWRAHFTDDRARPRRHTLDGVDYTLVHAAQANDRYIYRYVLPWDAAHQADEFALLAARRAAGRPQVQLYGHTHVPTLVRLADGAPVATPAATPVEPFIPYALGDLALVNPGSVGQPRDLDTRAAYAVLDTAARTVTFRRVAYDLPRTDGLMAAARYPVQLRLRLKNADAPGGAPAEWLAHFEAVRGRGAP